MRTHLRILNLEDNPSDAELNEAMISARWPDCEFIVVPNREKFLTALGDGDFDVILSDYTIPGFDGREALRLAREVCPETPFLFVSGTIGEDTAIEALKNGATDYVLKHRPVRLIPAVDRALREVQERNERELAERAMRQSEYKYRELFESLSDGAFLADEQTGKIIDTNRSAETMTGCSRAEVLGQKQSKFLEPDQSDAVPFGGTEPRYGTPTHACSLRRADGRSIRVQVRSTHLTLYGRPLVLRLCEEKARP